MFPDWITEMNRPSLIIMDSLLVNKQVEIWIVILQNNVSLIVASYGDGIAWLSRTVDSIRLSNQEMVTTLQTIIQKQDGSIGGETKGHVDSDVGETVCEQC